MTSYHVSMLYHSSIGMGCPNNVVQFNKCKFKNRCNIDTNYSIPLALDGLSNLTDIN